MGVYPDERVHIEAKATTTVREEHGFPRSNRTSGPGSSVLYSAAPETGTLPVPVPVWNGKH